MPDIIRLFRSEQREQELFVALLRPHIDLLYRLAYRWTGSRDDAEDLVQDILLKLAPRVAELRQLDQPRPWLARVLYRRFVDLYRREERCPVERMGDQGGAEPDADPFAAVADPEDPFQRLELGQLLERALAGLDHPQRDVVLLHDMEGYSALEVAEILGINVGTVKSRLHRARAQLKKCLGPGTFSSSRAC